MISRQYVKDYRVDHAAESGRGKAVPVYTGVYYRFCAGDAQLRRAKRRFCVLVLLCALAALLPLLLDSEATRHLSVLLPLVAAPLPVFWLLAGLRRLWTAGERVTREHRDKLHDRFAVWSLALLALSAASVVGESVFCVRNGCGAAEAALLACGLLQGGASLLLFREKKVLRMEEVPPRTARS